MQKNEVILMPLPMIHLSVAVNIEGIIKPEQRPVFLLGSISPDAIHMRLGADKEDKSKTHCIGKTRDETLENVRAMLRQAKIMCEEELKIFILGYCTHILTDVIWADTVQKDFINKVVKVNSQVDPKPLYYNETDHIDFNIFRNSAWRERVWKQLLTSKSPDCFQLLTLDEIEKWKIRTLTWFEDESKDTGITPQFITEDIIERFIIEATDFVHKEICTYRV